MAGKTRPSLRAKTLQNVALSNLSLTDKQCIESVFEKFEALSKADNISDTYYDQLVKVRIPLRLAIKLQYILSKNPKADNEEVKRGEWLPVQYTYFGLKRYECSECKDDEYWQKRYLEHKEKYCPNCGAKMDGGNAE